MSIIHAPIFAQDSSQQTIRYITGITKSVLSKMPPYTQFSYAVIRGDSIQYYGFEKQEQDQVITVQNQHALYEIGSITKPFTALLAAHLEAKGIINLSQKISDFLDVHPNAQDITILQLLNHTAGLPRVPEDMMQASPLNPFKDFDIDKMKKYVAADIELIDSPGNKYAYSNIGYGMLGYLLQKASGQSYSELLHTYIKAPLKMDATHTYFHSKELIVTGRDTIGKATPAWDLNAMLAAGGLKSSVSDLSKLIYYYLEGKDSIYNRTLSSTFTVQGPMSIGLAWHKIENNRGDVWYFHNGGTFGYSSSVMMNPVNGTAVILLTNLSAYHKMFPMIDRTVQNIMKNINQH